jgi:hypothetical protein
VKDNYAKKFEDLKKHMTELTQKELDKKDSKMVEMEKQIESLKVTTSLSEETLEQVGLLFIHDLVTFWFVFKLTYLKLACFFKTILVGNIEKRTGCIAKCKY